MQITFYGAAGTVTGSKHLITTDNDEKILLDCGMFQGEGDQGHEWNRNLNFKASEVDFVILSHAHIDHTGLLPRFVKLGFRGPVYCNQATRDLCELMLADSAHIQEHDIKRLNKRRLRDGLPTIEPLYGQEDVDRCMGQMQVVSTKEPFTVGRDTQVSYNASAHIIGSCGITMTMKKKGGGEVKLHFSGDIGRPDDRLLHGPDPFPQVDYILCESTYGDRIHATAVDAEAELLRIVEDTCIKKRGKLIIPAFAIDRTQELVFMLDRLSHFNKLPQVHVYVDSPMSVSATRIINKHREEFNKEILEYIAKDGDPFAFPNLHYVSKVEDSKAINTREEACVIISASGMAEAGRIKHHIANNVEDPKNTILLVGYASPHSLAGRLKRGEQVVRIFGEEFQVRADVYSMENFSAHGDYKEMLQYLSCQDASKVKGMWLVHGDQDAMGTWKSHLLNAGFRNVEIAQHWSTVELQ